MRNNSAATIGGLLLIVAGTIFLTVQRMNTNMHGWHLAELLMFGGIAVLRFFSPLRDGGFSYPRRDPRWNLLVGLAAIVGLIFVGGIAYRTYYEPMIQTLNNDPTATP